MKFAVLAALMAVANADSHGPDNKENWVTLWDGASYWWGKAADRDAQFELHANVPMGGYVMWRFPSQQTNDKHDVVLLRAEGDCNADDSW